MHFHLYAQGPSINYVVSVGGGGQKLPILHSKMTTKSGGGGQKSPILRRHTSWTAPYTVNDYRHHRPKITYHSMWSQISCRKLKSSISHNSGFYLSNKTIACQNSILSLTQAQSFQSVEPHMKLCMRLTPFSSVLFDFALRVR